MYLFMSHHSDLYQVPMQCLSISLFVTDQFAKVAKLPDIFHTSLALSSHTATLHNGGARGHFNFSQFWDLLTRCINFYSNSLIFPAILPPLIVYNLFI